MAVDEATIQELCRLYEQSSGRGAEAVSAASVTYRTNPDAGQHVCKSGSWAVLPEARSRRQALTDALLWDAMQEHLPDILDELEQLRAQLKRGNEEIGSVAPEY